MEALSLGFTSIPLEDIGYLAIFLVMVLDGANIPFTPNELFLAFTGYLARTGEVNAVAAYAVGLMGSMTGHLISFILGWKFGRPFFEKYGKVILITKRRLEISERRIKRFGGAAPFIIRFIPGLRNVGSLLLGVFRVPQGSFIILTAAGIAIYNALFFLTGFVLAEQFASFKELVFKGVVTILTLGFILAAITLYRTRKPPKPARKRK